jgi:hypothetical protein
MRFIIITMLFTCRVAFAGSSDPIDYWKAAPRGTNMYSGNPVTDYDAFKSYNGRFIRFGATGSPADFTYLIKGSGDAETFDLNQMNLHKIRALFEMLQTKGLHGVITLSDIPGRRWQFRTKDCRIWSSEKFQEEFVSAWKIIAQTLLGIESVVGFDLMNEPYLPGPRSCKRSKGSLQDLRDLYKRTIAAIRSVNTRIPIILESPAMASVGAMDALPILAEKERILYSFHYYEPYAYYSALENQGTLTYPGRIPDEFGDTHFWDFDQHRILLKPVVDWQKRNAISSYRIYVGEFGVWRQAQGAEKYVEDVTSLFNEQGWSWSYYSFREDGWANTDLEKVGADTARQQTRLFKIIQRQFK